MAYLRRARLAALAVWLLVVLSGCGGNATPLPPGPSPTPAIETLQIGLTSSAAPFADLVDERYRATNERAVVQFVVGTAATLLEDLDAGRLDAVLVHYLPETSQLWFNPVALDGLVVVVHPENPIQSLTRPEVQAIYNGRITTWPTIGANAAQEAGSATGLEGEIVILDRERGSDARTLFNQRIMVEQRVDINAVVVTGNRALLAAVASEPAAIGYTMLGGIDEELVRAVAIDGVAPTPNSTGTQNYPLTAPLYFAAVAEPQGELREFLAWLQSGEGQLEIGEIYGRVR